MPWDVGGLVEGGGGTETEGTTAHGQRTSNRCCVVQFVLQVSRRRECRQIGQIGNGEEEGRGGKRREEDCSLQYNCNKGKNQDISLGPWENSLLPREILRYFPPYYSYSRVLQEARGEGSPPTHAHFVLPPLLLLLIAVPPNAPNGPHSSK